MMNAAQTLLQTWLPRQTVPPLPRTMGLYGRHIAVPSEAILPQPEGYPYVAKDKLGSPYFIWRGTAIPRSYQPGRRQHASPVQAGPQSYADAVRLYGSQRKAATALGISLGKLQRGLRK